MILYNIKNRSLVCECPYSSGVERCTCTNVMQRPIVQICLGATTLNGFFCLFWSFKGYLLRSSDDFTGSVSVGIMHGVSEGFAYGTVILACSTTYNIIIQPLIALYLLFWLKVLTRISCEVNHQMRMTHGISRIVEVPLCLRFCCFPLLSLSIHSEKWVKWPLLSRTNFAYKPPATRTDPALTATG